MDPELKDFLDKLVKAINEDKVSPQQARARISARAKDTRELRQLSNEFERLIKTTGITAKLQQEHIKAIQKEIEARNQSEKILDDFKDTAKKVKDTFIGLGDATTDGANRISYYSGALANVPFVGSAIDAFGKSLDFNVENFRSLSSVGADFGKSLVGLRQAAREATLPLKEFTDLVGTESRLFAGLFGSVTEGAKQFSMLARGVRDQLVPQFAGLGLTTENYLDFLGTFLEIQRTQGRRQFQSQEETNAQLTAYVTVLDRVTKLTGISRDQLNEQVRAQREDAVFQNFLRTLEPARAAELQTLTAGLQSLNPALGDAVKNILATGFPLGEFEGTLVGTTDGLLDNILALREGSMSIGQFTTNLNDIASNFQNSFGPEVLRAGGIIGDVGNSLITITSRFGDLQKVLGEQALQGTDFTRSLTETQESLLKFKSAAEGLQTDFLGTVGPRIAQALGITSEKLDDMTTGILKFSKENKTLLAGLTGAVSVFSSVFDYAKLTGATFAGTYAGVRAASVGLGNVIGKSLSFLGRGAGAVGTAGLGVGLLAGAADKDASQGERLLSAAGSTASFAATGALVGSIIPGLGTLTGAIIGGALGAVANIGAVTRERGGKLNESQLALVGEAGPELFIPKTSGDIVPMVKAQDGRATLNTNAAGMTKDDIDRLSLIGQQQITAFKSFNDINNKIEQHLNTLVGISAKTEKNTDMGTRKLAKLSPNLV